MSESSRRKRSSPKAASSKRSDQGSDPKKLRYKISRKIPDPKWTLAEVVHPHQPTSPRRKTVQDTQLAFAAVGADASEEARPFLKWAGGKGRLLKQLDRFFPKQVDRYFEPFVGGGAVFFHLKHRFPQMNAFLRDSNPDLINTYKAVRDFPKELMRRLDAHLECFKNGDKTYFERVSKQYDLPEGEVLERAARMIFLNKTCFNGLWRVNRSGKFNAPMGRQEKYVLYQEQNILAASRALQGVHLAEQDFSETLHETRRGDFAYVDPPYVPVSKTANFTGYAKKGFGPAEQKELAMLFADAVRRKVRLMLSNSDTPIVHQLYGEFTIQIVLAGRAINSKGSKRGKVNELVILAGGER